MNISLLKEVQQACGDLKLSSKKVGRRSNGCFRIRNFDTGWLWALVTVEPQDAVTILAAAKLNDTSEVFARVLHGYQGNAASPYQFQKRPIIRGGSRGTSRHGKR